MLNNKKTTEVTFQNRLRSWMLWSTVLSFVVFILKTYFDIEIPQGDKLVDGILLIATLVGLINNPSIKNKI